jgi:hypothetical protein
MMLYVAGEMVDAVARWQPLSPFHQALAGGTLNAAGNGSIDPVWQDHRSR